MSWILGLQYPCLVNPTVSDGILRSSPVRASWCLPACPRSSRVDWMRSADVSSADGLLMHYPWDIIALCHRSSGWIVARMYHVLTRNYAQNHETKDTSARQQVLAVMPACSLETSLGAKARICHDWMSSEEVNIIQNKISNAYNTT